MEYVIVSLLALFLLFYKLLLAVCLHTFVTCVNVFIAHLISSNFNMQSGKLNKKYVLTNHEYNCSLSNAVNFSADNKAI